MVCCANESTYMLNVKGYPMSSKGMLEGDKSQNMALKMHQCSILIQI